MYVQWNHFTPETNTTLQINYTSILNTVKEREKKGGTVRKGTEE